MQYHSLKKSLFFLLLIMPCMAMAQPYLLLHRQLKEPAEITNYLEPKKIVMNYFPVLSQDVDSLIKVTEHLIAQIDQYEQGKLAPEIEAGHTKFVLSREMEKAQNSGTLHLLTRTGNSGFSFELISSEDGRQQRVKKLHSFLAYLRNNRLLLKEPL